MFIAVMAMLAFSRTAGAQSVGMVPAEIRDTFKPAQPIQTDLIVSNDGAAEISMRTTVTDLWYDAQTNERQFPAAGTTARSASSWIEVVPRTFTVPAHGSAKVKVIITPPLEAHGGYYAVVFVESKPELTKSETSDGRAIYTNLRLGSLVSLTAAGTEEYKVVVSDAKLTPPGVDRDLKLEFQFTNASNTQLFPQAKIAILDEHKKIIARGDSEPKRFLPDQKDAMAVSWNGTLKPGNYTAILTLLYADKVYTEEYPFTVSAAIRD